MSRVAEYLSILGLGPNASLTEIKKAFRKKAKMVHPDVNPSPEAGEMFRKLNDAYEYLEAWKNGKILNSSSNTYTHTQQKKDAEKTAREAWRQQYKENLKREQEIWKAYYKKFNDAWKTLFGWAFLIFLLPLAVYLFKAPGAVVMILLGLYAYKNFAPLMFRPLKELQKTLHWYIHEFADFAGSWASFIPLHLLSFCNVVLGTMVPTYILWPLYVLSIVGVGLLLFRWIKPKKLIVSLHIFLCIAPVVPNALLDLNFLLSYDAYVETHFYKKYDGDFEHPGKTKILLQFPNDTYAQYHGIRWILADFEPLEGRIDYIVKRGLFGIKVVTGYRIKLPTGNFYSSRFEL
jgi:hypothetical protein